MGVIRSKPITDEHRAKAQSKNDSSSMSTSELSPLINQEFSSKQDREGKQLGVDSEIKWIRPLET